MGLIVSIVVLAILFGIGVTILDAGLPALICTLACGGIGYAIGSWLGGSGWAIFGSILGGLIGLAAAKGEL